MAARGSCGSVPPLDTQQLFLEAEHRWLQPAEICEIIQNHHKFVITSEPPTRPPSGSIFLFNRKVLRYFQNDGHNWRKHPDGKTAVEHCKTLKIGSVHVLQCYCAHEDENERFRRRAYWMILKKDLADIVFVHYLEVKDYKKNSSPSNHFNVSLSNEHSAHITTIPLNCGISDSATTQQPSRGSQEVIEPTQMQSAPETK